MDKRKIGNTDLEASVVGFGCWGISGKDFWNGANDRDSEEAIKTAFENGVNFYDVAPIYGFGHAEEVLGRAVKGFRDKIIIASKCGLVWDDNFAVKKLLDKKSINKEIDDSLRRLNTDHVDLYQLHWPDFTTPIEETMEAVNMIKKSGKIRHIGVSNFPVDLAKKAMMYGEVVSQQCLYNMFDRNEEVYHVEQLGYLTEKEILPFCRENNLAFFPYSPLSQGMLTDTDLEFSDNDVRTYNPNFKDGKYEKRLSVLKKLREIAGRLNKPLSQIAINWLIDNPVITSVICGALNAAQARENCLSNTWKLDNDTMKEINAALEITGQ